MNCIICNNSLGETIHEIQCTYTSHSNTLLIDFIKRILCCDLNEVTHPKQICNECYCILIEFDSAELLYKRLRKVIYERWSPSEKSCCSLTKDACCQTDDNCNTNVKLDSIKKEFSDECSDALEQNDEQEEQNEDDDEEYKPRKRNNKKRSKRFECKLCRKRFASKNSLTSHVQRQHQNDLNSDKNDDGNNEVKLECDVVINNDDNNDEQLNNTMEINNTKPQSTIERKRQRTKRTKPSKCLADIDEIVIKPLKYSCPECPKKWRTTSELRSHIATHSTLRPFICEICGQAYKHKTALDVHVGMHNGINPFSCTFCNKSFTQKGALQRHMPIHTGDAPYQCDLCGKRFVHHTSFNMHTLAHTGQKSYKCNVCGLALLSGSHLKRHMRVHTGERPYACVQCGKRFAERYNLVAHQRLHEAGPSELAKRVHRCQVCGAGFDRRPKLEEHLANNHNKIAEDDQSRKWVGHFLTNS